MEQGGMVLSDFHQTLFYRLLQAFCPVLSWHQSDRRIQNRQQNRQPTAQTINSRAEVRLPIWKAKKVCVSKASEKQVDSIRSSIVDVRAGRDSAQIERDRVGCR
ncbi:MAG: hypothetical protein ACEQSC_00590 [Candidatus Nanopelagicaceae bacterium]